MIKKKKKKITQKAMKTKMKNNLAKLKKMRKIMRSQKKIIIIK